MYVHAYGRQRTVLGTTFRELSLFSEMSTALAFRVADGGYMNTLILRRLAHEKPHVWTWEATTKILLLIQRVQGLHSCSQEQVMSTDMQGSCRQGHLPVREGDV